MIVATIIGLAIAGGIYWQQNPDIELRTPSGLVERVGEFTTVEQTPESFTSITARSTPDGVSQSAARGSGYTVCSWGFNPNLHHARMWVK